MGAFLLEAGRLLKKKQSKSFDEFNTIHRINVKDYTSRIP